LASQPARNDLQPYKYEDPYKKAHGAGEEYKEVGGWQKREGKRKMKRRINPWGFF
jgi:hypothetical protein